MEHKLTAFNDFIPAFLIDKIAFNKLEELLGLG